MNWTDYDNRQIERKAKASDDFCSAPSCQEDGDVFCDGCRKPICANHTHDNASRTRMFCGECRASELSRSINWDDAAIALYAGVA